jgi:[ribosomal protein S18]-alanine N-acetyltransferase
VNFRKINFEQLATDYDLFDALVEMDRTQMVFPWSRSQWQDLFQSSLYHLFIIEDSNQLLGLALYRRVDNDDVAHLYKIIVGSESRGSDLALDFFARQKKELLASGAKSVYLEVSDQNLRAIAFYRKLGFHELHRVSGYYSDGSSALMMELQIETSI